MERADSLRTGPEEGEGKEGIFKQYFLLSDVTSANRVLADLERGRVGKWQ